MNPSTTSSVASLGNIGRWAVAPLQIRSFTSIQILHTHTHTPRHSGANEMTMKMRWKWTWDEGYLTRTWRGERKRRGKEQTPTQHTWPETGKTLKRQGKKKSGGRRTRNQTSGGGGGRKRLNQLTKAKPKPTSARAGPNLPEERRTQKHMRKGTHGG